MSPFRSILSITSLLVSFALLTSGALADGPDQKKDAKKKTQKPLVKKPQRKQPQLKADCTPGWYDRPFVECSVPKYPITWLADKYEAGCTAGAQQFESKCGSASNQPDGPANCRKNMDGLIATCKSYFKRYFYQCDTRKPPDWCSKPKPMTFSITTGEVPYADIQGSDMPAPRPVPVPRPTPLAKDECSGGNSDGTQPGSGIADSLSEIGKTLASITELPSWALEKIHAMTKDGFGPISNSIMPWAAFMWASTAETGDSVEGEADVPIPTDDTNLKSDELLGKCIEEKDANNAKEIEELRKSQESFYSTMDQISRSLGFDPRFGRVIASVETTSGRNSSNSSVGAQGVIQVMPKGKGGAVDEFLDQKDLVLRGKASPKVKALVQMAIDACKKINPDCRLDATTNFRASPEANIAVGMFYFALLKLNYGKKIANVTQNPREQLAILGAGYNGGYGAIKNCLNKSDISQCRQSISNKESKNYYTKINRMLDPSFPPEKCDDKLILSRTPSYDHFGSLYALFPSF